MTDRGEPADRGEPGPRRLFDRMAAFARLDPRFVSNFCLEGPIDVPTVFEDFIGIFPKTTASEPRGYAYLSHRIPNPVEVYAKILSLELPERVKKKRINDEPKVRELLEFYLALTGMPSIMIGLGKTRDTGEEAIFLFCAVGISPQIAFKEIKQEIRTGLYKSN